MRAKNLLSILFAAACAVASTRSTPATASVSVGITVFHEQLAPYGSWVTVGGFGTCWRPAHVAVGWQPYLHGEWIYTDDGWTWASFDPWGPYPWHYGTWTWAGDYGWVWIPGTVWAPAWVTWYVSGDYCGWAPVPPSLSVGISGYFGPAVTVSASSYVFVPTARFAGVDPQTVRMPPSQNAALAARATPMTRFGVSSGVLTAGGPAVAAVERARGSRIPRASVAQARTQPMPVASAASHGRVAVVAPAAERARLVRTEAAPRHEPQHQAEPNAARSKAAPPSKASTAPHERAVAPPHEKKATSSQAAAHPQAAAHSQTTSHPQNVARPEHAARTQTVERPQTVAHSQAPAAAAHPQAAAHPHAAPNPQGNPRPPSNAHPPANVHPPANAHAPAQEKEKEHGGG